MQSEPAAGRSRAARIPGERGESRGDCPSRGLSQSAAAPTTASKAPSPPLARALPEAAWAFALLGTLDTASSNAIHSAETVRTLTALVRPIETLAPLYVVIAVALQAGVC
jgi:hypothetical protein